MNEGVLFIEELKSPILDRYCPEFIFIVFSRTHV